MSQLKFLPKRKSLEPRVFHDSLCGDTLAINHKVLGLKQPSSFQILKARIVQARAEGQITHYRGE